MIAYLSYKRPYACLSTDVRNIYFAMPVSLLAIKSVLDWSIEGCITFLGKYDFSSGLIEDYIDVDYLLEQLDIDRSELLEIEEVVLQ